MSMDEWFDPFIQFMDQKFNVTDILLVESKPTLQLNKSLIWLHSKNATQNHLLGLNKIHTYYKTHIKNTWNMLKCLQF
jgi:hypothetical protein